MNLAEHVRSHVEYATHALFVPRNMTSDRMTSLATRSTTTFCKPSAYTSAFTTT